MNFRPMLHTQTVLLLAGLAISALLLIFALREFKHEFNPSEWYETQATSGRLFFLPTWNLEFFSCSTSEFSEKNCPSISGPFAFEQIQIPMNNTQASRFAQIAPQVTHAVFSYQMEPKIQAWVEARASEEYLTANIVFFQNKRCFRSQKGDVCKQMTEAFPVTQEQARSGKIRLVMPTAATERVGPQRLTPILTEQHLVPEAFAIDLRGTAAFSAEAIVGLFVTLFFGVLSLVFPRSPAQSTLFLYALLRVVQTSLSYTYEVIQPDWLIQAFGSSGYHAVTLSLDALILIALLYLVSVFLRGSFRINKMETGYGLAILLMFCGIGLTYSSLNDLAVVSHFVRDTLATLFAAIWIIYRLLMNWHEQREHNTPDDTPYATISIFLLFLLAYGSACAQSALASRVVPNLILWENLLFLPGLGLSLLVDQWLRGGHTPAPPPGEITVQSAKD